MRVVGAFKAFNAEYYYVKNY